MPARGGGSSSGNKGGLLPLLQTIKKKKYTTWIFNWAKKRTLSAAPDWACMILNRFLIRSFLEFRARIFFFISPILSFRPHKSSPGLSDGGGGGGEGGGGKLGNKLDRLY